MSGSSRGSLSRRLLTAVVLVGLLIVFNLGLFGWLIFRSLSAQELNRIMSQTRAEAEAMAGEFEGALEGETGDILSAIIRRQETQTYIDRILSQREIVATVRIFDANGAMIYEAVAESRGQGESLEFAENAIPSIDTQRFDNEESFEVVEVPVGKVGSFVIGLSQPELDRRVAELRRELIQQATVLAIVTIVVLISAYVLVLGLLRRSRRLEDRAREAEQMAYVGTLASGLAHEIRSPLNSLNLNMQMLQEDDQTSGSPMSRRLLSITRSEISRLEGLVTNFLSYARPRSLDRRELEAGALFDRLEAVFGAQLAAAGVEVEWHDETDGTKVDVDVDQMGQLLLNLAQNALAATQACGRPGRIRFRVEDEGDDLVLSVEDNGVGINAEQMERIFDLFYSTRKGGTGLGLAIAQRIANAHGGDLEIGSVEGQGTVVRLRLERVRSVPQTQPAREHKTDESSEPAPAAATSPG